MTKEKLYLIARDYLEPLMDQLADMLVVTFAATLENMSKAGDTELVDQLVDQLLKNQADALLNGIKSVMPEDFESKLKEVMNGGL